MRDFWLRLQLREQLLLGVGGTLLLLLFLYLRLLEPLLQEKSQLQERISRTVKEVSWMRGAAAEVEQLRQSSSVALDQKSVSLLSLTDKTARKRGLGEAIKRVQPEGDNVQIWFEGANFNALSGWIDQIYQQHRIEVSAAVIDKMDQPGLVKVRLVVTRP